MQNRSTQDRSIQDRPMQDRSIKNQLIQNKSVQYRSLQDHAKMSYRSLLFFLFSTFPFWSLQPNELIFGDFADLWLIKRKNNFNCRLSNNSEGSPSDSLRARAACAHWHVGIPVRRTDSDGFFFLSHLMMLLLCEKICRRYRTSKRSKWYYEK